jgi:hypothetical protein
MPVQADGPVTAKAIAASATSQRALLEGPLGGSVGMVSPSHRRATQPGSSTA